MPQASAAPRSEHTMALRQRGDRSGNGKVSGRSADKSETTAAAPSLLRARSGPGRARPPRGAVPGPTKISTALQERSSTRCWRDHTPPEAGVGVPVLGGGGVGNAACACLGGGAAALGDAARLCAGMLGNRRKHQSAAHYAAAGVRPPAWRVCVFGCVGRCCSDARLLRGLQPRGGQPRPAAAKRPGCLRSRFPGMQPPTLTAGSGNEAQRMERALRAQTQSCRAVDDQKTTLS